MTKYSCKPLAWRKELPMNSLTSSPSVPVARSGHRIVYSEDSFLYLFGGYNPELTLEEPQLQDDPHWAERKPLLKELWKYNIHSKIWTKINLINKGSVPSQLASHSLNSYGDELLIYGGTGAPFGIKTSTKLYKMNKKTETWNSWSATSFSSAEQRPPSLYGQGVDICDNKLVSVGGTSGFDYGMSVHSLDLTTAEWQCLSRHQVDPTFPKGRYRHEICIYNKKVYVFGGGTSYEAFGFGKIWVFDLLTQLWGEHPTMPDCTIPIENSLSEQYPAARRCHNVIRYEDDVFIFGGFDGARVFSDFWRLNLKNLTWSKMPKDLPQGIYFAASCVSKVGKAYFFGGVENTENNSRSNKMFSTWLTIPSLKVMCFEALLHYMPTLYQQDDQVLLQNGIPYSLLLELRNRSS